MVTCVRLSCRGATVSSSRRWATELSSSTGLLDCSATDEEGKPPGAAVRRNTHPHSRTHTHPAVQRVAFIRPTHPLRHGPAPTSGGPFPFVTACLPFLAACTRNPTLAPFFSALVDPLATKAPPLLCQPTVAVSHRGLVGFLRQPAGQT